VFDSCWILSPGADSYVFVTAAIFILHSRVMKLAHASQVFPGLALVLGVAHGWGANAPDAWWLQLAAMTFAIAAIFVAARNKLVAVSILSALVFFAASAATAHAWLFDALARVMMLGAPLTTVVFGALVVLLCLLPAACAGLAGLVFMKSSHAAFAPLVFAAGAPLAEIATNSLVGFAWSSAGYAPLGTPLAALYPWIGVYGVAALVSLLAAMTGAAIAARFGFHSATSENNPAPSWGTGPLALAVAALGVALSANYLDLTSPAGAALHVRLIQPAVDQREKFDGARMRAVAEQLASLARVTDARPAPQLIVAPETALPHLWPALPTDVADSLLKAVSSGDRVFLVGMFDAEPEYGLLNVSNALRANSASVAPRRHVKRRLVPVAERPTAGLRWLSDALALHYPARASLPETAPVFEVGGIGVRTTICLDLAFGADLSEAAGATGVIVNQSNLSALPGERVRAQFTTIARVRALEQGKPLLLVANDGPTAVIDARGNVLASLPAGEPAALSYEIVPRNGATPYALFGESLWLGALALGGFAVSLRRSGGHRSATRGR
jgi:apolipoprotein N-acyltransferase